LILTKLHENEKEIAKLEEQIEILEKENERLDIKELKNQIGTLTDIEAEKIEMQIKFNEIVVTIDEILKDLSKK
jgi:hypothetical protein